MAGFFREGSSSQSRKINCKWEIVPWSLRASSMCWSAGDTVVDGELATTMLFSAQRRHQDQHDRPSTVAASHHTRLCGYLSLTSVCPANPPPCPAHSVICLLSLSRSQPSILVLLSCARPPNAEQRASARSPTPLSSLELFRSPSHVPGP